MSEEERRALFVCDGHPAAKAIIGYFQLQRDHSLSSLPAFSNSELLLVESRGGRVGAASAVSFLIGRTDVGASVRLFHVGEAIERPLRDGRGATFAGRLVLVNRIVDVESGRVFLPDILLRHDLIEAEVITDERTFCGAERSIAETAFHGGGEAVGEAGLRGRSLLIDRELSGFAEAALTFCAPHQLYCLAAVVGSGKEVGDVVTGHCARIEELLRASAELCAPVPASLGERERARLTAIARELRLTHAQAAILLALGEGCAIRHGGRLPDHIDGEPGGASGAGRVGNAVRTKQERSELFERLKRAITE